MVFHCVIITVADCFKLISQTIALLFRPLAEAFLELLLITAITLTSVNYIKRLVGYHWHQQSCVFIMLSYPEIPERFVWKNLDR